MALADLTGKVPPWLRKPLLLAVFAAAYYCFAIAGLAFSFPPEYTSAIWPTNALLLVTLLLTPINVWGWVALACLPGQYFAFDALGIELHRQIAVLAADIFSSGLAVVLLRRFRISTRSFDSPSELSRFWIICLLAPALAAFPGAAAFTYSNPNPYWTIWRDWFVRDFISFAFISPLLYLVFRGDWAIPAKRNRTAFVLETSLFTGGFLLVLLYLLSPSPFGRSVVPAVLYLPLPFFVWAAVRFGPGFTYASAVAFSFASIWSATAGYGIFSTGVPQTNILSMQIFLILSLTPTVFLSAAIRGLSLSNESERRVEQRFHTLFEDVPIGLWMEDLSQVRKAVDEMVASGVDDLEGHLKKNPHEVGRLAGMMRVTDVNPAVLKLLGASSKEELLENIHRVFDVESIDGLRRMIVDLYSENAAARSEGVNHGLDGRKLWVDVHAHALPGFEKNWSQIIVSTSDLTERKLAEKALSESDKRHRDILEAMTDGLVITDMEGRVESANRAAAQLYGYTPLEMEGLNFPDVICLSEPEKFTELRAAVEAGDQFDCESVDKKKDGAAFDAEIRATKIYFGQKPHLLLLIRDISERKQADKVRARLEEQLRRAQKLEAIGTLAGGVAHDFNNLLAAIMGYAELSLQKLPKGADLHEYISRILKAGERARNVVRQILSFSRQTELEKQRIDIRSVFNETLRLLRATIPTNIEMVEKFPDEPVVVLADPTQMHQVLMNLATNSYHAINDQVGKIEITLRKCPVKPDYAELIVADTGQGIQKEHLQRIFDPYFTTKEVGQGSGMGLAVVQGIVAEHCGEIEVSSVEGAGCVFRIHLPLAEGAEERLPSQERRDTATPFGSHTVLVVDDEPAIAELIQIALGQYGYRVVAHTSPIKALEEFLCDPAVFDVVVSDQTMPEMTGTQLAKRLLAARNDIPIILCTGHSETVNIDNAQKHGIRHFFMKPVKTIELAQTIRALASK